MAPQPAVRATHDDIWTRLAGPLGSADTGVRSRSGLSLGGADDPIGDAELVRRRLDATVPGAWELHVELQPAVETSRYVVKTRLVIMGIAREDFGEGFSLASASDDGLTKAAKRFGIGASTSSTNIEPSASLADLRPRPAIAPDQEIVAAAFNAEPAAKPARKTRPGKARSDSSSRKVIAADEDFPSCPRCGDIMWDDRGAKKADDAPDFRCRRKGCAGSLWVDHGRTDVASAATKSSPVEAASGADEEFPF